MSLTFTVCIKETECILTRNANIHGFASLEELTILFLYKESTEFSSFICYHISSPAIAQYS